MCPLVSFLQSSRTLLTGECVKANSVQRQGDHFPSKSSSLPSSWLLGTWAQVDICVASAPDPCVRSASAQEAAVGKPSQAQDSCVFLLPAAKGRSLGGLAPCPTQRRPPAPCKSQAVLVPEDRTTPGPVWSFVFILFRCFFSPVEFGHDSLVIKSCCVLQDLPAAKCEGTLGPT